MGQKEREILTEKGGKRGGTRREKRGKTGMIAQKRGRLKGDKSVSMGTLSMKILKAAS